MPSRQHTDQSHMTPKSNNAQTDHHDITNLLTVEYPHPAPITQAVYKNQWSDFEVTERLELTEDSTTNNGEHLWLWIKKQGMNTSHVATALAKWAKVSAKDVGYSGIKDRHAVTYQWFSIRIPSKQLPSSPFYLTDVNDNSADKAFAQALNWHWQNKKLKRGTHKHNDFSIILRHVQTNPTADPTIEQQLTWIRRHGVPNYFGKQRFGHDGNTLADAIAWLDTTSFDGIAKPHASSQLASRRHDNSKNKNSKNKNQRDKHSLMLSALRSVIFNQILAERVRQNNWDKAVPGDVFNLSGSGSVFTLSDTANNQDSKNINHRLQKLDIHPTIPLWGQAKKGNPYPSEQAMHIAQTVINANPTLFYVASRLQHSRIDASLRPTRLTVDNLSWQWLDDDQQTLSLSFTLPKGSYATTVLAGLVNQLII